MPASMGNTLVMSRVQPGRTDLLISWDRTDEASVSFAVHRGTDKVAPYPLYPLTAQVRTDGVVDHGVVPDGSTYFYQVAGVNCVAVEGQ